MKKNSGNGIHLAQSVTLVNDKGNHNKFYTVTIWNPIIFETDVYEALKREGYNMVVTTRYGSRSLNTGIVDVRGLVFSWIVRSLEDFFKLRMINQPYIYKTGTVSGASGGLGIIKIKEVETGTTNMMWPSQIRKIWEDKLKPNYKGGGDEPYEIVGTFSLFYDPDERTGLKYTDGRQWYSGPSSFQTSDWIKENIVNNTVKPYNQKASPPPKPEPTPAPTQATQKPRIGIGKRETILFNPDEEDVDDGFVDLIERLWVKDKVMGQDLADLYRAIEDDDDSFTDEVEARIRAEIRKDSNSFFFGKDKSIADILIMWPYHVDGNIVNVVDYDSITGIVTFKLEKD